MHNLHISMIPVTPGIVWEEIEVAEAEPASLWTVLAWSLLELLYLASPLSWEEEGLHA
jgi:hypothetical protein